MITLLDCLSQHSTWAFTTSAKFMSHRPPRPHLHAYAFLNDSVVSFRARNVILRVGVVNTYHWGLRYSPVGHHWTELVVAVNLAKGETVVLLRIAETELRSTRKAHADRRSQEPNARVEDAEASQQPKKAQEIQKNQQIRSGPTHLPHS